jgi:hypothetical protein
LAGYGQAVRIGKVTGPAEGGMLTIVP